MSKPPDQALCANCMRNFRPRHSPMVAINPRHALADIRAWVDRHETDDDPPKVAVAYVDYLLRLVEASERPIT